MKTQATYRSNLDYERTYQALSKHPQLKSIDDVVGAGIIAWFRGSQPFNIRISPRSKVVITYSNDEELEEALSILEKYGIPLYGSRPNLDFQSWNPPHDEMRYIYDRYEKGHLWHPPFCVECMREAWSLTFQLQNVCSINFNPAAVISEWMKNTRREWFVGLMVYSDQRILRDSRVLEAMLQKNEA